MCKIIKGEILPKWEIAGGEDEEWMFIHMAKYLKGVGVFQRGYIWRVGDGSQINIWDDSWIPSSHNMKVLTPRGNNLITKVEDLINPVTGLWDEDLIRSMFWEIDSNRIMQIPLRQGREDVVAWHYNKNGLFSVGSAYHLQWSHKFGANGVMAQAGGMGDEKVWSKLWKLDIPAKIKIFGWRVLHGLIPCKGILANRHIDNSSSCPICHGSCEDIKHVLFGCQRAKEIWHFLGVSDKIQPMLELHQSGSVAVADIILAQQQVQELNHIGLAELILTGGWYIWWERRKVTHGDTVQHPTRTAIAIASLTTNFQRAGKKGTKEVMGWRKPPEGELLLNVDASFRVVDGSGSIGAVIRDSSGSFVGARVRFFEHVSDAVTAEATALREGMSLAQSLGCNRINIQSDCSEVVDTMNQGGFSATVGAPIFDECYMLWQDFSSICIEHCNREANSVAHELARVAMQKKLSCNWVDEPPRFIIAALVNDVTVIQAQ